MKKFMAVFLAMIMVTATAPELTQLVEDTSLGPMLNPVFNHSDAALEQFAPVQVLAGPAGGTWAGGLPTGVTTGGGGLARFVRDAVLKVRVHFSTWEEVHSGLDGDNWNLPRNIRNSLFFGAENIGGHGRDRREMPRVEGVDGVLRNITYEGDSSWLFWGPNTPGEGDEPSLLRSAWRLIFGNVGGRWEGDWASLNIGAEVHVHDVSATLSAAPFNLSPATISRLRTALELTPDQDTAVARLLPDAVWSGSDREMAQSLLAAVIIAGAFIEEFGSVVPLDEAVNAALQPWSEGMAAKGFLVITMEPLIGIQIRCWDSESCNIGWHDPGGSPVAGTRGYCDRQFRWVSPWDAARALGATVTHYGGEATRPRFLGAGPGNILGDTRGGITGLRRGSNRSWTPYTEVFAQAFRGGTSGDAVARRMWYARDAVEITLPDGTDLALWDQDFGGTGGGGFTNADQAVWGLGIIVATAQVETPGSRIRIYKRCLETDEPLPGARFDVSWAPHPNFADADPPWTDPGIGEIVTGAGGYWDSYIHGGFREADDNPLSPGTFTVYEVEAPPGWYMVPSFVTVLAPSGRNRNSGNAPPYAHG